MAVKCILTGQTPSVLDGVTENVQTQLNDKVDKITGKGLSTNDYTSAEKTKLSGIETGAQKNTVTSVNKKTGAVSLVAKDVGAQPSISANGILKGDGSGNITAANETEVELVSLPNICNPNLLDNWYFGKPVNQRGQTSYTGTGYGIDRWMISTSGNSVMTVVQGGLSIAKVDSAQRYAIILSVIDAMQLLGQRVTVSAIVDNNLLETSCIVPTTVPTESTRIAYKRTGDIMVQMFLRSSGNMTTEIVNLGDAEVIAKAIKLELGSEQTLAHQENGNWVLNEIPDYGEQLRRCQRYYEKKTVRAIGLGSKTLYLCENFIQKRAYPTVSLSVTDYSNLTVVNSLWMIDETSVSGVLGDVINVGEQAHYYGTMTISADL